MPLTRLATDAFGVVTIALVSLLVILGVLCIIYSLYFHAHIKKQGLLQLGYFNGPWVTRIAFTSVAIWWSIGEILRLSLLKGRGRLFTSLVWQKNVYKYYILSNIDFAEPNLFLILVLLLHALLRKRESGTLSRRWNARTIGCALLLCIPMFILQLGLIFFGPKFLNTERNHDSKLANYFWSTSYLTEDSRTCTYPLFSTALLGFYDLLLIGYVSYLGARVVSLVINKGLKRRAYILILSVILFLPSRALLLGFTVLTRPGHLAFEALIFLAFLMLLLCALVGMCMLIFYPVADALALAGIVHLDIEEVPFDDYYDGASLIPDQSQLETGRNSDVSTKRGSISFRTMIKDDSPVVDVSDIGGPLSPAARPSHCFTSWINHCSSAGQLCSPASSQLLSSC